MIHKFDKLVDKLASYMLETADEILIEHEELTATEVVTIMDAVASRILSHFEDYEEPERGDM